MAAAQELEEIGPYRIIDLLGEGGMGRVYRAEQQALGREVALKVLPGHIALRPGFRERFLREVRASARVNHPNVVTCYDAGETDGRLWLALELVDGGDAAELMRQGPVAVDRALAIIADAAEGLQAIADAGLVHRDIKPGNIFLTRDGRAKLADLGLARQLDGGDRLTTPGVPLGTPCYMPPEQAAGDEVDIRADIYALGATLYALLIGAPPFIGETPIAVLRQVLDTAAPDPRQRRPELSAGLADLIASCLAKDPAGRPAAPAMLATALRILTADARSLPVVATPAVIPATTAADEPTLTSDLIAAAQATPTPPDSPASTEITPTPGGEACPVRSGRGGRVDPAQLQRLARRIHVTPDRLTAWMNLAPGATFPAALLEMVLDQGGVRYGRRAGAILAASRPSDQPRRLILAEGDPPYPGIDGTGIEGQPISGSDLQAVVRIDADAMEAWAYVRPGETAERGAVEREVKGHGLRYGLLREAVIRLWAGPPVLSGRLCIARGRPAKPTRHAGYQLLGQQDGPHEVRSGSDVAIWEEPEAGLAGMDLLGRTIPVQAVRDADPRELTGEGVDIARDKTGALVLRAIRDGVVHRRVDGTVRVVPAIAIHGDLGPDHPPISSDDLVVVHGSILPGARISAGGDVVVLGDLHDAVIEAGGCIEVAGDVRPGEGAVCAAETMVIGGSVQRQVIAGSLRIGGALEHCQVAVTGNVEIHRMVGGAVIAGGDISVDQLGDEYGTTTELWAGHQPGLEEQGRIEVLAERALAAERKRILTDLDAGQRLLALARRRQSVANDADWTADTSLRQLDEQVERLAARRQALDRRAEEARARLAEQRRRRRDAARACDDSSACIQVRFETRRGAVLRIADSDPLVQREDGGPTDLRL